MEEERVKRIIIDLYLEGYNVAEIKEYLFDSYEKVYPAAKIERILEENQDLIETRRGLKAKNLRENIYESMKKLRRIIGYIESRILKEKDDSKLTRNLIMLLEQYRQVLKDFETIKGNISLGDKSVDIVALKGQLEQILPEVLSKLEKEGVVKIKDRKRVIEIIGS